MPKDRFKSERDKEARDRLRKYKSDERERQARQMETVRAPFNPTEFTEEMRQKYRDEKERQLIKRQLERIRPEAGCGSAPGSYFSTEILMQQVGVTGDLLAEMLETGLPPESQDANTRALSEMAEVVRNVYHGYVPNKGKATGKDVHWELEWMPAPRGIEVNIRLPAALYCELMASHEPAEGAHRMPRDLPPVMAHDWDAATEKYSNARRSEGLGGSNSRA